MVKYFAIAYTFNYAIEKKEISKETKKTVVLNGVTRMKESDDFKICDSFEEAVEFLQSQINKQKKALQWYVERKEKSITENEAFLASLIEKGEEGIAMK